MQRICGVVPPARLKTHGEFRGPGDPLGAGRVLPFPGEVCFVPGFETPPLQFFPQPLCAPQTLTFAIPFALNCFASHGGGICG